MTAQLTMIIPVELVGVDGVRQRREIATVKLSVDEVRLDDFGLSLEDAKEIQLQLQSIPPAGTALRNSAYSVSLRSYEWT